MNKKKEAPETKTVEDRQAATEENRRALIDQDIAMHAETGEKSPVDQALRNSKDY